MVVFVGQDRAGDARQKFRPPRSTYVIVPQVPIGGLSAGRCERRVETLYLALRAIGGRDAQRLGEQRWRECHSSEMLAVHWLVAYVGQRMRMKGDMKMFRKTRIFCGVLLAALATASLASAEQASCPVPTTDPLVKLLAPPPCDTCAETKAEVEELQGLQRDRSDAQSKHALADYEISVARFIDGADIKFDAAALAKCQPIFDKLGQMTKEAATHAKNAFCRTRPFALPDSGLKPLDAGKLSPSYPSAHTTFGTALGTVLAQMVPEKRDMFYARSADYGHSRMIAGVHDRSDVEAGKILGMEVAAEAFGSDKAFQTLLPEGTKCVRAALGLAAEQQASTAAPAAAAPAAKP